MNPAVSNQNTSQRFFAQQTRPHAAMAQELGPVRRLLASVVQNWRRRKMIAVLQALDTRTLRDIGIERCDIASIVDGFDARELRMVPLAAPQRPKTFQQA